MHDGIALERRGTPAAVVCTEPFLRMGRATAAVAGLPDYPFAVVEHPIGSLSPDGLCERAMAALPQVIAVLIPHPSRSTRPKST